MRVPLKTKVPEKLYFLIFWILNLIGTSLSDNETHVSVPRKEVEKYSRDLYLSLIVFFSINTLFDICLGIILGFSICVLIRPRDNRFSDEEDAVNWQNAKKVEESSMARQNVIPAGPSATAQPTSAPPTSAEEPATIPAEKVPEPVVKKLQKEKEKVEKSRVLSREKVEIYENDGEKEVTPQNYTQVIIDKKSMKPVVLSRRGNRTAEADHLFTDKGNILLNSHTVTAMDIIKSDKNEKQSKEPLSEQMGKVKFNEKGYHFYNVGKGVDRLEVEKSLAQESSGASIMTASIRLKSLKRY